MTSPKQGITNITRVVDGLLATAVAIQNAGADGWQITDAGLVLRDRVAIDRLAAALDAVSLVGDEVNDLDFSEIMQLAGSLPAKLAQLVPKR